MWQGWVLSRTRSWPCWRQRCHEYLVLVSLGLTPTASVSSKPSYTTLQTGQSPPSPSTYDLHLCRQPYDKQQCRHLLSDQPEDPDDTDREEEDLEDLFVPEPFDDYTSEDTELHQETDDYDSKYDGEEQQAWLELHNVSRISVLWVMKGRSVGMLNILGSI